MTLTAYYHKYHILTFLSRSVLVSSTCSESECLCDNYVDISPCVHPLMALGGNAKGLALIGELRNAGDDAGSLSETWSLENLFSPHASRLCGLAPPGMSIKPAQPAMYFFLKCRHVYPVAFSVPPRAS